ncbi:MAG: hypothetical protein IT385_23385 [Deltaproteobacteria bacterium]|nr:hypothetical protein [Deltaproteobacteria bacterium]
MRRRFAIVAAGVLAATSLSAPLARAEWRRTSDVELSTAYTLEENALSVGVLSPLSVGVTESFQASIHPLLLLLGQPSLAFRVRLTPVDTFTVSLDLAGAWSFINRETEDGSSPSEAAEGELVGFPGTLQLGATMTWALGSHWLLSAGVGPAVDFLGDEPIRGMALTHLSVHWLPGPRHLLMFKASGYVDLTHDADLVRPTVQLAYSWAASARVHLLVGLGIGDWVWETSGGGRRTVRVFPLVDVVFRF